MRNTRQRNEFKRCFRRVARGRYRDVLAEGGELRKVITALENDEVLDYRYHDHPLKGDWLGSRECHIAPDLLLVYTLEGENILWLERLGSHAEIFGM